MSQIRELTPLPQQDLMFRLTNPLDKILTSNKAHELELRAIAQLTTQFLPRLAEGIAFTADISASYTCARVAHTIATIASNGDTLAQIAGLQQRFETHVTLNPFTIQNDGFVADTDVYQAIIPGSLRRSGTPDAIPIKVATQAILSLAQKLHPNSFPVPISNTPILYSKGFEEHSYLPFSEWVYPMNESVALILHARGSEFSYTADVSQETAHSYSYSLLVHHMDEAIIRSFETAMAEYLLMPLLKPSSIRREIIKKDPKGLSQSHHLQLSIPDCVTTDDVEVVLSQMYPSTVKSTKKNTHERFIYSIIPGTTDKGREGYNTLILYVEESSDQIQRRRQSHANKNISSRTRNLFADLDT